MEIHDICVDEHNDTDADQRSDCSDEVDSSWPLQWTDNPCVWGVLSTPYLTGFLTALPYLRSITLFTLRTGFHGLSWETLEIILTLPHLPEFTIRRLRFNPLLREGGDINAVSPSPLTVFRHQVFNPCKPPGPSGSETDSLASVLQKTHLTLETLHLFAISAPIQTLVELEWPRLHELVFHGKPWSFFPPLSRRTLHPHAEPPNTEVQILSPR